MNKEKSSQDQNSNGDYILPDITDKIQCPICQDGTLKLNRIVHKLPDGEEILIVLMECDKCTYQDRDVITLNTSFAPGTYNLEIKDGDLNHKIFRGPGGFISIPEAEIDLEPGNTSRYMVTNIEGLINRMIEWTEYLQNNTEKTNISAIKRIDEVLQILKEIKEGKKAFHIILKDEIGGSYVSASSLEKKEIIRFTPFVPDNSD